MSSKRILQAYGTSLLGVFSGLLTNLWFLRALAHAVSRSDLGIYAFALQLLSYLGVLQLGIDFAVSRQIAECLGRGDAPGANQGYWELRRFNRYTAGAFVLAILAVCAGLAGGFGIADPTRRLLAVQVALLAGLGQAAGFVAVPYAAALIGSQRIATINLLGVVRTISTTLIAMFLLWFKLGILAPAGAEVITQFLAFAAIRKLCRQQCHWATPLPPERNTSIFHSVLRFGALTTLGGFAWTIEAGCDVIILGLLGGPAMVALYVVWWRFPQMFFACTTQFATSAFPTFAERHGISLEQSRGVFNKGAYVSLGLATLICLGTGLWLPWFMKLWLGPEFLLSNGYAVALMMGLLICLRTCGNYLSMFWLASGRAQLTTGLAWLQAVTKVSLGLLLVQRYGILGLLVASCLASLIQVAGVGVYLQKKSFISRRIICTAAFLVILAISIPIALKGAIGNMLHDLTVLGFLGSLLFTSVLWSLLWFVIAWHSSLRENFQTAGAQFHNLLDRWNNVATS